MTRWYEDENETENGESCKHCRFFLPYLYEVDDNGSQDWMVTDYGQCRRFPPKAKDEETSIYPVVTRN